ncbi:MAG: AN1-type zinc finger domain-containing protein [Candidatus Thorarchaeota archaeon]
MNECSLCGKQELCFTCHYCKGLFCAEHRLPESHGCPGLNLTRSVNRLDSTDIPLETDTEEEVYLERPWYPRPETRRRTLRPVTRAGRFTRSEIRNLLISAVLVIMVAISVMGGGPLVGLMRGLTLILLLAQTPYWWFAPTVIGAFLVSFLVHEMAHKFTAQHYGMDAEFRMMAQGYYLSAMAILFSFPVFGTGAVFTSTPPTIRAAFWTKAAGPLSNLVIGIAVLFVWAIAPLLGVSSIYLSSMVRYVMVLNSILGLFNIIPIEPFDGASIFRIDRRKWAVITIALVVLLVTANLLIIS